jgi:anti-anti-sigma factor
MSETQTTPWLERQDLGEVTVMRVKTPKALDDDILQAVFEPVFSLCDLGRNRLVLNLAAVEGFPSMALGRLVMLNRRVQVGEGRLVLCQLPAFLREILDSTRLCDLLDIFATEQDALQAFTAVS